MAVKLNPDIQKVQEFVGKVRVENVQGRWGKRDVELDKRKIKTSFDINIPFWKDSLNLALKKIKDEN